MNRYPPRLAEAVAMESFTTVLGFAGVALTVGLAVPLARIVRARQRERWLRERRAHGQRLRTLYGQEEWPMPASPAGLHDPTFLFVFTLPYSGSTALAQVLSSAPGSMLLHPTGEGQALIRGLRGEERWSPDKPVNWESVRAVWMHRIHTVAEEDGPVKLVVEKSPPNMVRAAGLLQLFPKHQIIATNRNPYAFCASSMYRNHDTDSLSEEERSQVLRSVAARWISCSRQIKDIVETHAPLFFTYEEFCDDVAATLARAVERIPALEGASADARVEVKDYTARPISNQNQRQVALLSEKDRAVIGKVLRSEEALLSFFGYSPTWGET